MEIMYYLCKNFTMKVVDIDTKDLIEVIGDESVVYWTTKDSWDKYKKDIELWRQQRRLV